MPVPVPGTGGRDRIARVLAGAVLVMVARPGKRTIMAGRYEAVKPPRFEIEQGLGGERIRIRAGNLFALLFIPFWLVMWTIGGVTAVTQLLRGFDPFVAFWLAAWVAGGLAIAFT